MIRLFSVAILMFDLSSPYVPSTVVLVRQASDSVKLKRHCQYTSLLLSLSFFFFVRVRNALIKIHDLYDHVSIDCFQTQI